MYLGLFTHRFQCNAVYFNTTTNYNLNNKHIIKLMPIKWKVMLLQSCRYTHIKPSLRDPVKCTQYRKWGLSETLCFRNKITIKGWPLYYSACNLTEWVNESPLREPLRRAGQEKPNGRVPKNNCLTIIAYLTFQTMKMLITLPMMHQFVGLPEQVQNRLHPIHYRYPEASMLQVQLATICWPVPHNLEVKTSSVP